MKLIFIRHAEPDYSIDSLTQKGFREAEILAHRTSKWPVSAFYCSPLGRARDTSLPTLSSHQKEAVTYEWLREFHGLYPDPANPERMKIVWDQYPEYLDQHPILFDPEKWAGDPLMMHCDVRKEYDWVCNSFDELLATHGYHRSGKYYTTNGKSPASDHYMKYDGTTIECLKNADPNEPVLVFFCHLGVTLTILSHLLNTSPCTLWQGIFLPPASVTVVSAEEREKGSVYFRCQEIGDTSHLREEGEPASYYGGFATPFQL